MDIPAFLARKGVVFHHNSRKSRSGWLNVRCPWCGKDPYLGINLRRLYANCWACGPHFLLNAVCRLTNSHPSECEFLRELPREGGFRFRHDKKTCGTFTVPHGVGGFTEFHTEYLRDRGFDPEEIKSLWRVQGIANVGTKLKWRLWIPIHLDASPVAWTTRAVSESVQPRYRASSPEESSVPVGNLLYGVDYCTNSVLVVEGPLDVWRVGPGAVAIMGSNTSPAQLERLSRFPVRYVCLDAEPGAQRRARGLVSDLAPFAGHTWLVALQSGKDPADAHEGEVKELKKLVQRE